MMKKEDLKKVSILFLISRVPFILVLIVSLIKTGGVDFLSNYDAIHYLNLAKYGYAGDFLYAFFPLYSFLIRLIGITGINYQLIGVLISNVFTYLSTILIYKMVKRNIKWFLVTPILIYTSVIYTESLFIFLSLWAFYLYREKKYIPASFIVGLSILTRNIGCILLLTMGIDILYRKYKLKTEKKELKEIIAYGLIAIVIGCVYPVYLYIKTGSFLTFVTVQGDIWYRVFTTPIHAFIWDIKVILNHNGYWFCILVSAFNWFSYIFGMVIGFKFIKKDLFLGLYTLLSVLFLSFSFRNAEAWEALASPSLYRYIFGIFALYLYPYKNKHNILLITFCIMGFASVWFYYLKYFLA